ncbi:SusC/RagA family TonB-linked outer membrane protein [Aureibaculum algae]|uniref:SusC/RagA family TonB-linked outer membrane protein n=2 Tax=Aureibaculum algae TaxID=2584122 RepID=A0A5B7TMG9_9FLAO|nr:SusC/RagA family TonB-linked outer membrane protein [Aureibaculum algae]
MKIKIINIRFLRGKRYLTMIMRTFIFLLCTSVFGLTSDIAFSQQKVTINHDQMVTIDKVFEIIKKQTDYHFIYPKKLFENKPKLQLKKGIIKVEDLLRLSLVSNDLNFELSENNNIIIKAAKKSKNINASVIVQEIRINGNIKDINGVPLIGANIIEKGTTNGVVSDFDGNFSIKVSKANVTLIASYIGFITKEIIVSDEKNITIILDEDASKLDEVVIIGYGQVRKKDATGAVVSIKPEENNRGSATKTTDLLLGKVAGLQITMPSGSPSSDGTIRIRQGASLNASNSPLIVVDGIAGESFNQLNSDDIENITVLKDASSTAIYGSRGANGVIIVTTKRGKASFDGKSVSPSFNYRGDFSINKNIKTLDVYNADEFRTEFLKRYPDLGSVLGDSDTDWQKEIYRLGFTQKHTFSATGALPYVPYRVSLGYQSDKGTIKNSKKDLATVAINLSPSFLNDHLKANITFKETYRNVPESSSPVESAAFMDPTAPVYATYPNNMGLGYYMFGADEMGTLPTNTSNPVASINLARGESKNYRTATNFKLSYNIHGFEDLTLTANLGITANDYSSSRNVLDNSPSTWGGYGGTGIGIYSSNDSYSKISIQEYYANYNHTFADIHALDVTFGHTYEKYYSRYENSPVLKNDNDEVYEIGSSGASERALMSYFGRANYNLNNRYLFTFTMRTDASSRFAPETRWGYFPSGAFAWKLNEEKFLENIDNLSSLKLRLSYGQTGQQDINNNYAYQASYRSSTDDSRYRFGDVFYTTYRPNAFDRNIQWEVTSTYNYGLDWGINNNRIYGSLDIYKRFTDNLLMEDVRVSAGSNFSDTLDQNIGEMESNGVEFSLGAILLRTDDLEWSVNANFAYNNSKIKKLTIYEGAPEDTYIKTGSIGSSRYSQIHKVGNTPYTYFLAKQVYDDETGKPLDGVFYNPNYDASVSGSEEFVYDDANDSNKFDTGKSSLVPYYGGLSTSAKYKDWDFGLNCHFAFGQYVFWETASRGSNESLYDSYGLNPKNSLDNTPEWSQEHRFSDYWLHKGDYFKLDNITVGYTMSELIKDAGSLRLSCGVQNVLMLTKYPGIDPEVYSGIDGSSYPRPRMFMFTANLKF